MKYNKRSSSTINYVQEGWFWWKFYICGKCWRWHCVAVGPGREEDWGAVFAGGSHGKDGHGDEDHEVQQIWWRSRWLWCWGSRWPFDHGWQAAHPKTLLRSWTPGPMTSTRVASKGHDPFVAWECSKNLSRLFVTFSKLFDSQFLFGCVFVLLSLTYCILLFSKRGSLLLAESPGIQSKRQSDLFWKNPSEKVFLSF